MIRKGGWHPLKEARTGLLLATAALLLAFSGFPASAIAPPPPAALNTNAATDAGADENAQVTTDGAGNWVAVWDSNDDLGGTIEDKDILVSRSADNGSTWSAPAALNTNASTDSGSDL